MTSLRPAAAGTLAAAPRTTSAPASSPWYRRPVGLLTVGGLLSASCVLAAGSPSAQAGPIARPSVTNQHQVLRPDADVAGFTPAGASSVHAALDDAVTAPGRPDAAAARAGKQGASSAVTFSGAKLGSHKPRASKILFSSSTGAGTKLQVEVLWRGKVRASTTVQAASAAAWRTVAFTPAGQADVDDLTLRFTAVGGSTAEVQAAYASIGRAGAGGLVLRPDGEVGSLRVRPSGPAWRALDDDVQSDGAVTADDDVTAARAGQSTTVTLADGDVRGVPGKSRAWFNGSTGSATTMRVEVVWGGSVHASGTVPARSAQKWRSVSFTPPDARSARDLQLRFTATGGKKATVRAAYVDLVTARDDSREVDAYLGGLQPVTSGPEEDRTTGAPVTAPDTEPLPDTSAPSGRSRYKCTSTPYSLSTAPDKIVALNPDANKLWLGGLLQGQGYAQGLGSLRELPIRKRAPLTIYTDLLGPGVTRTVTSPDPASVQQAVADLVTEASSKDVPVPARVSFQQTEQHSASEALLKLGVSAKYLGASVSGKLESSRNAKQSTVLATFFQRSFTVSMVTPSTPSRYFTDDFGRADLDEQAAQGRIAPDNPPVVVGSISYGRILMYSVTSEGSGSEISGALDAAWNGGATSGSVNVSAKQQEILDRATYRVVALGGEEDQALGLIRTHKLGDYFTGKAALATSVPISYQVDNIADGSAARFTETTSYDLTECRALANHSEVVGATVRVEQPKFYLEKGQSPAKLYGSISVNGSTQWRLDRNRPQEVDLHNATDPSPWQGPPDAAPWVVDLDTGQQLSLDASVNRRLEWWEFGADPSNQYRWRWTLGKDGYGEVRAPGGSSHSPVTLRFRVTKVADRVEWRP